METQLITLALAFICLFTLFLLFRNGFAQSNYTDRQKRTKLKWLILAMLFWVVYISLLAGSGFLENFSAFPPRIFVTFLLPSFALITYLIFSGKADRLIQGINGLALVYLQVFRIGVELLLWLMYKEGTIPVQMTFEGRNWDVVTGITALLLAFWHWQKPVPSRVMLIWNLGGLLLLINIVSVAVLSMPVPFRVFMNEPANTVVATFPFVFIPGIFVIMAYSLHFMSIRKLWLAHNK